MRFFARKLVSAAALALAAGAFAVADDDDHKKVRRLLDAGEILPLETILEKSLALYPGSRVIETEFEDDSDRYTYELEIIDAKGVVWEVEFDARTGDVLEREQDD
ncbi:MAG: PepSY domain-containing protein [Burkholderiales bacterium]